VHSVSSGRHVFISRS